MTITSLKSALQRIAQLEQENEQLRAELEVYKNRNTGGRKKHDEAWIPVSRIRTFTLSGRVSLSKAEVTFTARSIRKRLTTGFCYIGLVKQFCNLKFF